MNYTLKLSTEAVLDLQSGFDWYEEKRTGLGFDFMLAVRANIKRIERNPYLFQAISVEEKHIRRAVVQRFNYLIFYAIEEDEIWVFAILSSRQHPDSWQSRIPK